MIKNRAEHSKACGRGVRDNDGKVCESVEKAVHAVLGGKVAASDLVVEKAGAGFKGALVNRFGDGNVLAEFFAGAVVDVAKRDRDAASIGMDGGSKAGDEAQLFVAGLHENGDIARIEMGRELLMDIDFLIGIGWKQGKQPVSSSEGVMAKKGSGPSSSGMRMSRLSRSDQRRNALGFLTRK